MSEMLSVCQYFSCMLSLIDVRKGSQLKFINFFVKEKRVLCLCDGDRAPLSCQLWKQTCREFFVAHPCYLSPGRARVRFEEIIYRKSLLTSNFCICLVDQTQKALQCAKHLNIDFECTLLIIYGLVEASIGFAPNSLTGITRLQWGFA